MSNVRIIDVNHGVFEINDTIAEQVRVVNAENNTFMINLMASPGAGKTTFLLKTIESLGNKVKLGIMEADIDASVDAEKMADAGVKSIQVHTGGECAMDAEMTLQALKEFDTSDLDLVILENVGNLVCPAETDTGANKKVVLLSVPEGDDKPLKYPLMFEVADIVVITKIDTMGYFNFDKDAVVRNIRLRNKNADIIFLSAKTGEGFDKWIETLKSWIV